MVVGYELCIFWRTYRLVRASGDDDDRNIAKRILLSRAGGVEQLELIGEEVEFAYTCRGEIWLHNGPQSELLCFRREFIERRTDALWRRCRFRRLRGRWPRHRR